MSNKTYPAKRVNGKHKRLHRIIMEEKLGRTLESHEHVYHVDGDALNNDPENLVIIRKNTRKT